MEGYEGWKAGRIEGKKNGMEGSKEKTQDDNRSSIHGALVVPSRLITYPPE